MDYTPAKVRNASADFVNMLCIPSRLPGFINSGTELVRVESGREAYLKMPSKKDFDINSIPRRYK